jgi:hypothetical protein
MRRRNPLPHRARRAEHRGPVEWSAIADLVTSTIASVLPEWQILVAQADEQRGLVSIGPIALNDAQIAAHVGR